MANKNKEENFRTKELHKVALSSFVQGSYELDKTILNLSVGSLGFIFTFATTFKYSNNILSCLTILVFLISLFSFGFTIYKLLDVFKINKEYLKYVNPETGEFDENSYKTNNPDSTGADIDTRLKIVNLKNAYGERFKKEENDKYCSIWWNYFILHSC